MIYVIYDQIEVMILVDWIVIMWVGKVLQFVLLKEIYNCFVNKYVVGFIGLLLMNFMKGKIDGGDMLWFISGDILFQVSGYDFVGGMFFIGEVWFGICLEYVFIGDDVVWIFNKFEVRVELFDLFGLDMFVCVIVGEYVLWVCFDGQV